MVPKPGHPADGHLRRRDGLVAYTPFLPIYVQELGVADPRQAALWAGFVIAASMVINSGMTPVWAALADRFGSKLILLRAVVPSR